MKIIYILIFNMMQAKKTPFIKCKRGDTTCEKMKENTLLRFQQKAQIKRENPVEFNLIKWYCDTNDIYYEDEKDEDEY